MKLQSYEKQPVIDGVEVIDLVQHSDCGGSFVEIAKLVGHVGKEFSQLSPANNHPLSKSNLKYEEVQINHSIMESGIIKAFHCHENQTDCFYFPSNNKLIVILIDIRPISQHHKGYIHNLKDQYIKDNLDKCPKMRIAVGNKPQLLIVPPLVLHGLSNPYQDRKNIFYIVDKIFNEKDEFRVDYKIIEEEDWKIQNG